MHTNGRLHHGATDAPTLDAALDERRALAANWYDMIARNAGDLLDAGMTAEYVRGYMAAMALHSAPAWLTLTQAAAEAAIDARERRAGAIREALRDADDCPLF